jgi:ABC-type multidrug transport system fused ATPase/permease subunit
MLDRIRRLFNQFFTNSRTINNEPLNQVSLIVIILVDIFILANVFTGLNDISSWHISPSEANPCYSEWKNYRLQNSKDKDYDIIKLSLPYDVNTPPIFKESYQKYYQKSTLGHLGNVSEICLNYAGYKDKIYSQENTQLVKNIDQKQTKINNLEQANRNIRNQYDSTLLEKIAGQPTGQSINSVSAEKAKQELEQNSRNISNLKTEIANLKNQLIAKPESNSFLSFIKDEGQFGIVEQKYQQASFWYPSIQLAFQALFLLPLILVAFSIYKLAQRRGYGLISLINWHLLIIFFIPLILKIFEFLQVGVVFEFLFKFINALLGGLLFLISYLYILMIPIIGFGIIKFVQKFILNPKVQAANRVQKSCCLNCAKKIKRNDMYCPHCGYYQYNECSNCHNLTYKHLPHCKHCGHSQESNL